MTIMLAGGMTIAIPGVMPDVSAQPGETANLYVSATKFGGPMILEVIVRDPNLSDTDEDESEPDVTFDGNDLRMVQASDGYWYAYVAHEASAKTVNDYSTTNNGSLDFGTYCNAEESKQLFKTSNVAGATFVNGNDCAAPEPDQKVNVLKSVKTLNVYPADEYGNTDLSHQDYWPFIQLFDFSDDATIKVVYNGGGSNQEVRLQYEDSMDDDASYSLDRSSYPHGAEVHLTINDNQLNIDPTDEDIWTFNTDADNLATYYYVFDESGESATGSTEVVNYLPTLKQASFGDNGFLIIDPSPNSDDDIIEFKDNSDQKTETLSDGHALVGQIVTVQETAPNSGVFSSTDNAHQSVLKTTSDETLRDLDFTIDYNDTTENRIVTFFQGLVKMDLSSIASEWGSGESLTVNISDQDENKNTLKTDDFAVSDSSFGGIPTVEIGSPMTLASTANVTITGTKTLSAETTTNLETERAPHDKIVTDTHDTVQITKSTLKIHTDNKTKWEGFVAANATNKASEADQDTKTAIQVLIDGAKTGVTQIEAKITGAISADDKTQLDQYDVAIAEQTRINGLLSTSTSGTVLIGHSVLLFSKLLNIDTDNLNIENNPTVTINTDLDFSFINGTANKNGVHQLLNYNFESLSPTQVVIRESGTSGNNGVLLDSTDANGLVLITNAMINPLNGMIQIVITTGLEEGNLDVNGYNMALDFFTFGQDETGNRYNDAIYRLEAEETGTNTGIYSGTLEYVMLNQINIFKESTFTGLDTIGSDLGIIVHEDLTDEDAVELIYLDADGQGVRTQTSDPIDAPTYSGVVSFDGDNYKVADTVTITLEDRDLNTDSDVIDIYTVVSSPAGDTNIDTVALAGYPESLVLDVTFDDKAWKRCILPDDDKTKINGLGNVISSLRETGKDTGVFTTNFQIPDKHCAIDKDGKLVADSVTGLDMEVNYQDFRDASGETIEVGDSAGIRANTGSVSFDRTVYPVPFGQPDTSDSYFPIHASGVKDKPVAGEGYHLNSGTLTVHVRVNDPDYDISGSGQDKIAEDKDHGPVKVMVTRGSETMLLGTAGAKDANIGKITIGSDIDQINTKEYGPITETAPDSGIFELDLEIEYTDGPESSSCPESKQVLVNNQIHTEESDGDKTNTSRYHCILQGDILTVEYTDPTDASGDPNTITDSATFDLRNGVLQTDKSVYIIGSDMILTLIEPDFDLDNDQAETYDLDLIEWDSDAATISMGDRGGAAAAFDPEPSNLRETGDATGIFQIVIEIPESINNDGLERGEEIELEYTDWGPSGANYVGHEDEDVNVKIYTSNFGATIELDQKVYTWTDKVFITVVAPDHNFDGDLVDEIGNTDKDPLKVSTRGSDLDNYKLVETGTDTGIFTGEVILTGFAHNADGDTRTGDAQGNDVTSSQPSGTGPTSGFLPADDDDGLTVSFEYSEDETVVGSSLIRWNIGEVQWLEASYPASGTGVVRIIDPDMNLNPEAVDNFDADVWSDSDAGGIDLTVTETNEATGIFEGTVFFTVDDESSGHRLRVAEGDTVTAEYEDNTLPDPYTTADELDVTATTLIGTVVPPLERAPAANLRVVDAFGNSLDAVSVDQQVQVTADLSNGQDRDQDFAYLVQIQDGNGVTVSLAWITGSLSPGQSFGPALSWIPTQVGSYTATAFVWESVDNPTALSPPVTTTITVS